jgi:hypothetical protein
LGTGGPMVVMVTMMGVVIAVAPPPPPPPLVGTAGTATPRGATSTSGPPPTEVAGGRDGVEAVMTMAGVRMTAGHDAVTV